MELSVELLLKSGMCKTEEDAVKVIKNSSPDKKAILAEQAQNVIDSNFESCWKCTHSEEDENDEGEVGFKCEKHGIDVSGHDASIMEGYYDYSGGKLCTLQ